MFDPCHLQIRAGQIAGKPVEGPFDEKKKSFTKVIRFGQE